jgi:hypothetical protein
MTMIAIIGRAHAVKNTPRAIPRRIFLSQTAHVRNVRMTGQRKDDQDYLGIPRNINITLTLRRTNAQKEEKCSQIEDELAHFHSRRALKVV